jgi:CelD/BcsL family acetyltransferase involved in cellulose biosynthesis
MRLEVRDHLDELRGRWDELVASQPLPSPFLTSWWVENAAEGRTVLVCCMDGDELVGGAAFEVDRFGPKRLTVERVRFVGQGPLAPDHLGVIASPGNQGAVTRAIGGWLLDGSHMIDLDGLTATSKLPAKIGARVLTETEAPYMELKGEDWAKSLPGKLRSTISRSGKRLAREGYTVRRVEPSDIDEALETLGDLHESRWQDASKFGMRWDTFERIARAGAPCGGVVVHELASEERVIASEVELVVGSRVSFYQAGRLTDHELRGSGSVLRAAIIDWAFASGHREFDLLRGGESYKDDWATGVRQIRRARGGTGVSGRGAAAIANATLMAAPTALGAVARVLGEEKADRLTRRIIATVRKEG